jgi:hypothetical protein
MPPNELGGNIIIKNFIFCTLWFATHGVFGFATMQQMYVLKKNRQTYLYEWRALIKLSMCPEKLQSQKTRSSCRKDKNNY